ECPGPAPLPFVDTLSIGALPPCPGCPPPPICDTDSIPFFIGGHIPATCVEFRGIQLIPSPIVSPLPQPPIVRVLFAHTNCLGRPCSDLLVPWMASVDLPPLPPAAYNLIVEVAEVSACDSIPTPAISTSTVPFTVEACARPACYLAGWRHDPTSRCDAG